MHDISRFYDRYLLTVGLNLKSKSEILLNTLPPRTALTFLPSHSKGPYISCRMSNDLESFKRGSVLERNIKISAL
jgi:hypothetical protein